MEDAAFPASQYLPETGAVYVDRPGHLLLDPVDNSLYVVEENGYQQYGDVVYVLLGSVTLCW